MSVFASVRGVCPSHDPSLPRQPWESAIADPPGHDRPWPPSLKFSTWELIQAYRRRPTGWLPRGHADRLEFAAAIRESRRSWREAKQELMDQFAASLMERGIITEPDQSSSGRVIAGKKKNLRRISR